MSADSWTTDLLTSIDSTPTPTAVTQKNIIIHGNAAFKKLCGAVIGKEAERLFDKEHADFFRWLTQPGRKESDQTILILAVGKSASKEVLVQVWPIDEEISLLSIKLDYSLQRIADLDELTRLPNRRKANLLLEIERSRLQRFSGFCLAIGDIDKFKVINDTYGHQTGDDVLRHISKILQHGLRESDWVARWGGEEFLIFVNGSDLATAMQPMKRIHNMLNSTPFAGPPSFPVTMSFGIVSSENTPDIDKLISKADTLMYDAKHQGRNRIILEHVDSKIWFTDNIRNAIDGEKVAVVYTPIVDWNKNTAAVNMSYGLHDETAEETEKMLLSSERLRLRQEVDKAFLVRAAAELPKTSSVSFFLPVNDMMVAGCSKKLLALFKKFPYLRAGVSSNFPLSEDNVKTLMDAKIQIAMVDFSSDRVPLDLLSTHAVSHIVFPTAKANTNAAVLALLPKEITCYAAGISATAAKREKFAGLLTTKQKDKLSDIKLPK